MRDFIRFAAYSVRAIVVGGTDYYLWVGFLLALVTMGGAAYAYQLHHGLVVTAMTDYVSWGAYIANFTFCVGLAAAAVMVVIPAYIYKHRHLTEVVFVGELLAIAAVVVCLLFVVVDLGRPERFLHLMPLVGEFNFPMSILSWDVVVLNGYLFINLFVAGYLLFSKFRGRHAMKKLYIPFVFLSMLWAVSLHTVTAFLYVGLGGRPFWNSAILAPRFLASAFVAGPALIILSLRAIRRFMSFPISEEVITALRRIIAVTMLINLFLLVSELFKEFYTDSLHVASARYLFFGLHGHAKLVPFIWTAVGLNVTACTIFLTRRLVVRPVLLNAACAMSIVGIWIEKGMGLIVPGFIPTPLGEIVEYSPSIYEFLVSLGIWATGALLFTFLLKIAIPIEAKSKNEPVAGSKETAASSPVRLYDSHPTP